jgi:hypothetical protein
MIYNNGESVYEAHERIYKEIHQKLEGKLSDKELKEMMELVLDYGFAWSDYQEAAD